MNDLTLLFLVGLVVFSAIGVFLTRRIAIAAFALFSFLVGIAGIYACLAFHTALVAQILIYVGGVMVLVAYSLYLYREPDERPTFNEVRQSMGKAVLFLPMLAVCYFFLPWKPLMEWASASCQNPEKLPASDKGLSATGQMLATEYLLEFEWLGVLMLIALVVAGWYIKNDSESVNR
ncbi:MAG TPA: NADH-quinone oxidoreductase subunit J [Catalimonadaceae bacterium]|nr:NADH-quinone oxidoreductase subunit J [Catalimonadaceae bacterium]